MVSREDYAWAAGLFEGEGCFNASTGPRARGGRYKNCMAKLAMTDKDSVIRFAGIMGVGNIRFEDRRHLGHQGIWVWTTGSFEGTQHVVASLWFGLGRRRRDQARAVLGH